MITAEQQFLGLILWFFMYLKWPWLLRLFAVLLQKPFKFKIIEMTEIQTASTAKPQRDAIATAILNT